ELDDPRQDGEGDGRRDGLGRRFAPHDHRDATRRTRRRAEAPARVHAAAHRPALHRYRGDRSRRNSDRRPRFRPGGVRARNVARRGRTADWCPARSARCPPDGSVMLLTDDQRMIRDMVREFAEAELLPRAAKADAEARFETDVVQKLAQLNLFGLTAPADRGGAGVDFLSYVLALEEVGRAC